MPGAGFIRVAAIDLVRNPRIMWGVLIVRRWRLQIMMRFSWRNKNLFRMKTTFKSLSQRKNQSNMKNREEIRRVSHNLKIFQKKREVRRKRLKERQMNTKQRICFSFSWRFSRNILKELDIRIIRFRGFGRSWKTWVLPCSHLGLCSTGRS